MSVLTIEGLRATVDGTEILKGVDLEVRSGEVHAVMGPNGSGKSTLSHVLMGRPGYVVTAGSVRIDEVELLGLEPWERAQAGLFLALQYPVEVDGVGVREMLTASFEAAGRSIDDLAEVLAREGEAIGFDAAFLDRSINVDFSGGEKKRNETLQLMALEPRFAVLDELDSGLDVDALRMVSQRIERATDERDLGVLAITHYNRLLHELRPDRVHVLARGRIQTSGGPELAEQLEDTGYAEWVDAPEEVAVALPDPFADPLL